MTTDQFNKIVGDQITKTTDLLCKKGYEYADNSGIDRLSAFKNAAALQQCSTPVALGGMLAKHIVSIYQMLPDYDRYSSEKWDEKINDALNYLLLLKACLIEEDRGTYKNAEN